MTTDAILTRFDELKTWRQGDQRARTSCCWSSPRWAGGSRARLR